jgi:hypothetical protein
MAPAFAQKKSPAKPDVPPPVDEAAVSSDAGALRAEIEKLWARCYAAFDELLDALKASRDGAGLPREILRQQLMGHDPCICKVMMRLLAKDD